MMRSKSSREHDRRRQSLDQIQALVLGAGYVLPDAFVRLFKNDPFIDRIRHNNIWIDPVPLLIEPPEISGCVAVQFAREGQGCFYFSLLLCDDGEHVVLYHEEEIARTYPPPPRISDQLRNVLFSVCCRDFDRWLAYYFLDCRRHDARYADALRRFPGM